MDNLVAASPPEPVPPQRLQLPGQPIAYGKTHQHVYLAVRLHAKKDKLKKKVSIKDKFRPGGGGALEAEQISVKPIWST